MRATASRRRWRVQAKPVRGWWAAQGLVRRHDEAIAVPAVLDSGALVGARRVVLEKLYSSLNPVSRQIDAEIEKLDGVEACDPLGTAGVGAKAIAQCSAGGGGVTKLSAGLAAAWQVWGGGVTRGWHWVGGFGAEFWGDLGIHEGHEGREGCEGG